MSSPSASRRSSFAEKTRPRSNSRVHFSELPEQSAVHSAGTEESAIRQDLPDSQTTSANTINVPIPAHTREPFAKQQPILPSSAGVSRSSSYETVDSQRSYDPETSEEDNADVDLNTQSGTVTAIAAIDGISGDPENYRQQPFYHQDPVLDPLDAPLRSRQDVKASVDFAVPETDEKHVETPEEEMERLRKMDYKQRRKVRQKVVIEYNITSMVNRQKFLLRLARALMAFGSPSHRIEAQLLACSGILEVHAEFVHIPGIVVCSFGDPETKTSETHFVKCNGGLSLGCLHEVHRIYRSVVHDEICARTATMQLNHLLAAPPIYGSVTRIILAFSMSAIICPLAFGGSFLDMSVAGVGAIIVSIMQFGVASKSALYANVFEITMAIFMSLTARGLSSGIKGDLFCYAAISSAGIVSILPGYLILTSSLELASKNIICGSVKMVYALIYTLFLGFGLQIGSDLYLLFDHRARRHVDGMGNRLITQVAVAGVFVANNASIPNSFLNGTFDLSHQVPYEKAHIFDGCFRTPEAPWYLQPYPWWTQFLLVPVFSILSSLANMQPIMSIQLIVMVVISCAASAANTVANQYIFNRSDVVSAIGAFVVGVLGNAYSRKMGGTAFTAMVTGVLFLVPSGLSQAGGLTAGSGIDIGGAMIAVTIGITVGLFMSQALVYMFGSKKNAAMFSF